MIRALAAFLLLTSAACSSGAEIHLLNSQDLPRDLYEPSRVQPMEPRSVRALVYFVRTDSNGNLLQPPRLGARVREGETDRPMSEFVMGRLLAEPTEEERSMGYRTAIPSNTELLGVSLRGGVASVNLTAQFESAGAEVLHLLRIAQVVWTLTDVPGVDAVRFRIHGAGQPVIDQFGVARETVSRGRYSGLGPREDQDPVVDPGPVGPTGD